MSFYFNNVFFKEIAPNTVDLLMKYYINREKSINSVNESFILTWCKSSKNTFICKINDSNYVILDEFTVKFNRNSRDVLLNMKKGTEIHVNEDSDCILITKPHYL